MKYLQTIQKFTFNNLTKIITSNYSSRNYLGRWTIQYDRKVIDKKVDQANEDHCGCCSTELTPQGEDSYYIPFFY